MRRLFESPKIASLALVIVQTHADQSDDEMMRAVLELRRKYRLLPTLRADFALCETYRYCGHDLAG